MQCKAVSASGFAWQMQRERILKRALQHDFDQQADAGPTSPCYSCAGNMARLQQAIEGAEDLGATDAQLRGARQLLQRRQKRSSSGGGGGGGVPGSGSRHAGTPGSRHGARHARGPGGSGHGGSGGPFGGSPRPGSASHRGSSAGGTPRRAADVGTPSPVAVEQMAAPLSGLHADAEDTSTWHVVEAHGKHGGLGPLSSGHLAVKVPSPASLSADSTPSGSLRISSGAASTDGGDTPGSPPLAACGGSSGGMTSCQGREQPHDRPSGQCPERGPPSRLPTGCRAGSSPDELRSHACALPDSSRRGTPDAPPLLQPVPSVESPVSPPARAARHSLPDGAQLPEEPPLPRPDRPPNYSPPARSGSRSSPPGPPPALQAPQHAPPPLRPSTGSLPLDSSKWFDDADDSERPAASSLSADFFDGPTTTDAVVPGPAYSRPRSVAASTASPMAGPGTQNPREDRSGVRPAPSSAGPGVSPSAWESALSAFGYGGQTPPVPAHGREQQEPPSQQQLAAGDDRRSSWRRSLSLSAFQSAPSPAPALPPQLPLPGAASGWGWTGRATGAVAEQPLPRPASPAETGSPSVTSQLSPNAKEFRPEARRPSRLSASHRWGWVKQDPCIATLN